ncbi:MAG: response regulator [Herpetosiphonaceae bacterium]|nr:response regulator [Herpetosiphonaceae bacterium]
MGYRVFVVAGENEALRSLPSIVADNVELSMLQSSNEALWELQQGAPDVLVADYDLPGFSGLDLAALVPDFAPDTRVVLCSRTPQGDLAEQAEQSGIFRLLAGSATLAEINVAVNEALAHIPPPRPEPVYVEPEVIEVIPVAAPTPAPLPPLVPRPAPSGRAGPPQVSKAPTPASRTMAAAAQMSRAPGSDRSAAPPPNAPISKAPPAVSPRPSSAPPNAPMSKAPQRVSARPTPAPPRSSAPPPVSARPIPPPARSAPAAAAAPAEEALVTRFKKQSGALVLTAESLAPLIAKLKELGMQLGAQATVLTDRWGVPLVQEGHTSLPLPPFLPLLATSFSTMVDYTRQLHSDQGSGLYMHEGDRYDIYIFDVGQRFLLVMIFDKEIAVSKLGSVWVYAKRAVRELADELEGE